MGDPAEFSEEDFKPRGTVAIVGLFMLTLILLWLSVYLILIARGVTTT
ncbi:MAG: cytochrome c oxidase subunit 2A [Acidimicrobiales bacterium]|nr:cytochrome c oxidase subunit 2A [Acidimicrobiales bacterium]